VKLVVCIVHKSDKGRLSDELIKAGFKFTSLDSQGGFLRESNATLLLGVDESQVDELLQLIEANCHTREQVVNFMPLEAAPAGALLTAPVKVPVGGAVAFVLDVHRFERF
jgi:uncharacterized protein YaaQ